MTRRFYSNLAPTVMTTGSLTASATSVVVTSVTGFPTQFPYVAAIERNTASEELVLVTTAVGTSLTVTRGYGGTTGKAHAASVNFEHVVDATDADEANLHINSASGVHGVTGALVGTTDAQTVTSKTFTGSKAQATSTDPGLITQAAASGTQPHLIGKDSTGVTTEYTVAKGGNATFQAIAGTSVTASAALSGATATVSGAATVGSLTTAGGVTATGTVTGGNLTTAGTVTAGTLRAGNAGGRVGFNEDVSNIASTNITEAVGHSHGYTLVSGRRYRVSASVIMNAGADGVNCVLNVRFATGTVTSASTLIKSAQSGALTVGTVGRATVTTFGEFVSGTTGTVNIALGVRAQSGASDATIISSTVAVDDVGV
jgi:hypothetical protein